MPISPFPYINSVDLHWSRIDQNRQNRSKDGISSRIIKVLRDTEVKFDIIRSTLDTLAEFYSCNASTRKKMLDEGLFEALMSQCQSAIEAKYSRTVSRVLKCCLQLLKIDEDTPTTRFALVGLVRNGLLKNIMKAHRSCGNDGSVLKYTGYLLRYLAELGIVVDNGYGHDSEFLEDVSIFLLKREANVTTIFNYFRSIVLMRDSKIKIQGFVCSALYTTANAINFCDRSRHSVESYRILCTLLALYSWDYTDNLVHSHSICPNYLTLNQYLRVFDMIVDCLAKVIKNPSMVALICIAVRSALRPFVSKTFSGDFPQKLQRHLLSHSILPDTLISVITLHCDDYRVLVLALECLFCLSSPYRAATDESSYHIIHNNIPYPPEVSVTKGRGNIPPTVDERCADILYAWWPYAAQARRNARWRRRKSFCIFVVYCANMFSVDTTVDVSEEQIFPPLALIYSSIYVLGNKTRCVDKVFFSRNLCSQIASFL